jgi:hypothetical protein
MIAVTRRLRRQVRAIAGPALYTFLHAAFIHAMRPLAGRPMTPDAQDEAVIAMQRQLEDLADHGAFLFFGITCSIDLGPLDIQFEIRSRWGHFSLVAEPLIVAIMAGGRRGQGWLSEATGLTKDDLAR